MKLFLTSLKIIDGKVEVISEGEWFVYNEKKVAE
jgi:hypothetical protein